MSDRCAAIISIFSFGAVRAPVSCTSRTMRAVGCRGDDVQGVPDLTLELACEHADTRLAEAPLEMGEDGYIDHLRRHGVTRPPRRRERVPTSDHVATRSSNSLRSIGLDKWPLAPAARHRSTSAGIA